MEEHLSFVNNKGLKLAGVLRRPNQEDQVPLVVICHGLGSYKGSATYELLAADLERAGIASLRFDFSCHGESEGSYQEITLAQGAEDLKAAMGLIKDWSFVTASRVGLFGRSFGGGVVLRYLAQAAFEGPVSLNAPAVDMAAVLEQVLGETGIREWERMGYMVEPGEKKRRLSYGLYQDARVYGPYQAAKQLRNRVLIVHGDQDQTVPVTQSLRLTEVLGERGELVVISGADHAFEPGKREEAVERSVDFFKRSLK